MVHVDFIQPPPPPPPSPFDSNPGGATGGVGPVPYKSPCSWYAYGSEQREASQHLKVLRLQSIIPSGYRSAAGLSEQTKAGTGWTGFGGAPVVLRGHPVYRSFSLVSVIFIFLVSLIHGLIVACVHFSSSLLQIVV